MPTVQTSYDPAIAVAYEGMIAETQFKDAASRTVETAAIGFGLAIGRGAADESIALNGSGFEGITIADKSQLNSEYAVGSVAGLLRKGTIWVVASTAVTRSDPVTFTAATGVIGAGLARTIADAKFETTAAQGDLVRVYLG